MNEIKLSELQKEYRNFFLGKLNSYSVKSPAELNKAEKAKFFTEIKQDWTKIKIAKSQKKETQIKIAQTTISKKTTETIKEIFGNPVSKEIEKKDYKKRPELQQSTQQEFSKQIIKSQPNKEQTDNLKILFTPNSHFEQAEQYQYPVS